MSDDTLENEDRRDFLIDATKVVGGAGCLAAAWPFVHSMYPTADSRAGGITTVDLSDITPGDDRVVSWQGKPVFILHRTPQQVVAMEQTDGGHDPQADADRVKHPQWLVVIGVCTHLGCIPNRHDDGWLCPCHGSIYDESGRVMRGPAPRNLDVPPYEFTSDSELVIG